jgi:hypothetical protein
MEMRNFDESNNGNTRIVAEDRISRRSWVQVGDVAIKLRKG